MTVTTNTLGTNSAEIVITGPESYQNVAAAVISFITAHGWKQFPDTTATATASNVNGTLVTVTTTTGFEVGMPVAFTGATFGGIGTGSTYFIVSIPTPGVSGTVTLSTTSPIQNASVTTINWGASASGSLTMTSQLGSNSYNSGNVRQKIFYAYNLTGTVYKFIRLNLYDLTIDTALTYSGGSTFYNGNTYAARQCHFQHMSYPRDYYINTTGNLTAAANLGTNVTSPAFTRNNISANIPSGAFGATSVIAFGAVAGLPVYPGMAIAAYSPSSGNYAMSTVNAYNDSTGNLTIDAPYHTTAVGSDYTDWVILWPGTLNYNNSLNPCYVYISATARHICIQSRNYDGVWNDWMAVTEYENPLGISSGLPNSTGSFATNYGLTTGFMSGNSGYVDWINGGLGSPDPSAAGTSTYAGYLYNATTTTGQGFTATQNANSIAPGTISYAPTSNYPLWRYPASMHKGGKFVTYLGPISTPRTYLGRVNTWGVGGVAQAAPFATQTTKMTTPFGEAGFLGGLFRQIPQTSSYGVPTAGQIFVQWDEVFTLYFKGMGDVMPSASSTAAGKHWAVTPTVTVDLGNSSDFYTLASNQLLDQWQGPVTAASTPGVGYFRQNAPYGPWGSYSNLSSYSTTQPTPYGRTYGMKYVTTSLGTLNTVSVKVDANGFASNTGSANDHLIFSYPSYYSSTDLSATVGNKSGNALLKPTISTSGQETFINQQTVRTSQSVSVAFPK